MNADIDTHRLDFLGPNELEAMEALWRTGQLQPLTERVLRFVEKHRAPIVQIADRQDAASLLEATRRLIEQTGSLDPVAEAREQIREIHNEIWYRGMDSKKERSEIEQQWIADYAVKWRQWKDKEYLFIVVRCQAEILARLTGVPNPG